MMPLEQNVVLRARGWQAWRSSTRDRVVPMSSGQRVLSRIRIGEAMPVPGVEIGVARPIEERQAEAEKKAEVRAVTARAVERVRVAGVGERQLFNIAAVAPFPGGVPVGEQVFPLFTAPADGFLVHMEFPGTPSGDRMAVRTSGGRSAYLSSGVWNVMGMPTPIAPDFRATNVSLPWGVEHLLRLPVFEGEVVSLVFRLISPVGPGADLYYVYAVFEYAVESLPRRTAIAADVDIARGLQVSGAERESVRLRELGTQLELERERTERARLVAEARVRAAELALERAREVRRPTVNPFNEIIATPAGREMIRRREPVAPPPPIAAVVAPPGVDGRDKTFVPAWQPQAGAIGYLVPNPPRGGRVNVFDNRYTIWDVVGQKVAEGRVEMIRSTDQIPAEARISRNFGVIPSPQLPLGVDIGGVHLPGIIQPTPAGRVRVVPVGVPVPAAGFVPIP